MAKKRTRWLDLVELSRGMDPVEAQAQIRSLAADQRFAAVVAWLRSKEEAWAATVASQGMAAEHGKLAHAAGSLYCCQALSGSLRQIVEPPAPPPNPGD